MSADRPGNSRGLATTQDLLRVVLCVDLFAVVAFNSLVFGGVHRDFVAVSNALVLGLWCLWAVYLCLGRPQDDTRRARSRALPILTLLLLGVLALPFCPLPGPLLRLLSPKTVELAQYALHDIADGEVYTWKTIGATPMESSDRWVQFLTFILFFMLLASVMRTRRGARRFAWGLVGIGVLLAATTLIQIVWGSGESRYAGAYYRTFVNRNTFAVYMGMLIPVAIGLAASMPRPGSEGSGRRTTGATRLAQVLLAGIALLIAVAVFCSLSGGEFVAFIGTFALVVLLSWLLARSRRWLRWVIAAGIVLLLVGIWLRGEVFWSRLSSTPSDTVDRFKWWRDTARIIRDFPLLGGGLGSFPTLYQVCATELTTQTVVLHPHSDYLNLAAETGLLGALLLAAILFLLVKRAVERIRGGDLPARYLNLACLIGIISVLLQSAFTVCFAMRANVFLFLSLLALAQAPSRSPAEGTGESIGGAPSPPIAARIGMPIAIVLAAAFLLSYSWRVQSARALLREARRLAEQNAPAAHRIALLQEAVQKEPRLAAAHRRLGRAIAQEAMRLPTYSPADAASHFVKAISAQPLNGYHHFLLGCLYANHGKEALHQKTDRAEAELKKACRLYPLGDVFPFTLGKHYQGNGKIEEALECYRNALSLRPYSLRMVVDAVWGQTKSLDLLRKAVPPGAEMQIALAEILLRKKELDAAFDQIDYLLERDPIESRVRRSKVTSLLVQMAAWEELEHWVRNLLREDPRNVRLTLTLVSALSQQGKQAEAVELMEGLVEGYPTNPEYLIRAADLHSRLKNDERAEQLYARAVELKPSWYPRWGAHLTRLNELQKVVSLYRGWVQRRPSSASAHRHLGLALEWTGDCSGAVAEYERAMELGPDGSIQNDIERAKKKLDAPVESLEK